MECTSTSLTIPAYIELRGGKRTIPVGRRNSIRGEVIVGYAIVPLLWRDRIMVHPWHLTANGYPATPACRRAGVPGRTTQPYCRDLIEEIMERWTQNKTAAT